MRSLRSDPQVGGDHAHDRSHSTLTPYPTFLSSTPYALTQYSRSCTPSATMNYIHPITWDRIQSPLHPYPSGPDLNAPQFHGHHGPRYHSYSTTFPAVQSYMGYDLGNRWVYPAITQGPLQAYSTIGDMAYDYNLHAYQPSLILAPHQHIVSFKATYLAYSPKIWSRIQERSLSKGMRPIRSVNGLTCKACGFSPGNKCNNSQERRRSFSLPRLVNHSR